MFVCSLTFSDSLIAVYMLIILCSHYFHFENVAFVALVWKGTTWCRAAGTIMMASVLLSNMSTLLVAVDRLVAMVIRPLSKHGVNKTEGFLLFVLLWSLGIILPTMTGIYSDTTISNAMCVVFGSSMHVPFTIVYIICTIMVFMGIILLIHPSFTRF